MDGNIVVQAVGEVGNELATLRYFYTTEKNLGGMLPQEAAIAAIAEFRMVGWEAGGCCGMSLRLLVWISAFARARTFARVCASP